MKKNYFEPQKGLEAFTCPYCGVYARQTWSMCTNARGYALFGGKLYSCWCEKCSKVSLWLEENMIYPKVSNIPMPNEDLSEDIQDLYNQARNIYNDSPRGACALLRLAVQMLCVQLGEKGKNLNEDIANLVSKGLPVKVQQALDIVRLVGNNAVHPGLINLEDNLQMASSLFHLINTIAEKMITEPKELDELYNSLPKEKLEEIEKRDSK